MDTKKHNIRFLYWDVAAWGALDGIARTFLSVYALRLGASDQEVGLLAALPSLVLALWFIPAGQIVQSQANVKAVGLAAIFLVRIQYVVIVFLPFLPAAYRVPALVLVVALSAIPTCVGNVAFTNIIADAVPPADRPHVVSRRSILTSLSSAVSATAGGVLLNLLPLPMNYQILFVIAFAFGLGSLYALSRLSVAPSQPASAFSLRPLVFLAHIREIVAVSLATPDFMRFTLAGFVMHSGLAFAWPLFSLWWVNGLRASETVIGAVTTFSLVLIMIGNLFWARVAERRGNRFVFLAGFAGMILIPAGYCLSPSAELVVIPEILAGLSIPALQLGLFNRMLEVSPVERRPAYIAFFSAALNLPVFLAPIIATGIVAPLIGVWAALFAGTFVRLAAWLIVFLLLRQPATRTA